MTESSFLWTPQSVVDKFFVQVPDLIESTAKFVQIPSVSDQSKAESGAPFGPDVRKAFELSLDTAKRLGMETYFHPDGTYAWAQIGKGDKRLEIVGHVDVVSANPSEWQSNPWQLQTVVMPDGQVKFIGRGAFDDKGSFLTTLYAAAQAGGLLKDDVAVRVVLFGNEETGEWEEVGKYLARSGNPAVAFVPDAVFPLIAGEQYIYQLKIDGVGHERESQGDYKTAISINSISTGGNKANQIPAKVELVFSAYNSNILESLFNRLQNSLGSLVEPGEISNNLVGDRPYSATVVIKGQGGHASMPFDGTLNALQVMALALSTEPATGFVDSPPWRAIRFIQNSLGYDPVGRNFGFASTDPVTQGIHTQNIASLEADKDAAHMVLDVRVRNGLNPQVVLDRIKSEASTHGFEVDKQMVSMAGMMAPLDSLPVRAAINAYMKWAGVSANADIIGGGTFARAFAGTDTIAMAFGMFPPWDGEMMDHKPNEYMTLDAIVLGGLAYMEAILAMGGDPDKIKSMGKSANPNMSLNVATLLGASLATVAGVGSDLTLELPFSRMGRVLANIPPADKYTLEAAQAALDVRARLTRMDLKK